MPESLYCPIKNSECSVKPEITSRPLCFIAIPFRKEMEDTRDTVVEVLKKSGIEPYFADEDVTAGRDILCKICEKITFSDFGLIELTSINPNVMLEFGIILGRKKPFFILLNKGAESAQKPSIPVDVVALERIEYYDQKTLAERFQKGVKQYTDRLDRRERQIQTMMQLAKETAEDKDFASAERLLETVFYRMNVGKGSNGRFVGLMKDIILCTKDNPEYTNRYTLALARVYALQKNYKESVSTAKDAMSAYSIVLKETFAKAESIVQKSVIDEVIANRESLIKDPMFFIFEKMGKPATNTELFAYLWEVLLHLPNHEEVIYGIGKRIMERIAPRKGFMMPFRSMLWERSSVFMMYMSFLIAYREMYPDKGARSLKVASNIVDSFDGALERYYQSAEVLISD